MKNSCRLLLAAGAFILALCVFPRSVSAADAEPLSPEARAALHIPPGVWEEEPEPTLPPADTTQPAPDPTLPPDHEPAEETPPESDESSSIIDFLTENMENLGDSFMNGIQAWTYRMVFQSAEVVFTNLTSTSANIFRYQWFQVIVGLFGRFGLLLFAIGVVMAFVDAGIEYRRRGIDLNSALLNLGKTLLAVFLFYAVPVPLFSFCVNVQSVIMRALSIDWSFDSIISALILNQTEFGDVMNIIMTVIMIVLVVIVFFDNLKRGGILFVQICIGSLYMISVPRGYMDGFYSWCKQVIALCITALLQNLVLFCGLMIVPTNLFLGIGTMFAAKEVPRICAQFGLDTSVKTSFSSMAMGANASVQAIKAATMLFV